MSTQRNQGSWSRPGATLCLSRVSIPGMAFVALLSLQSSVQAQIPEPAKPEIMKRSGLLSRFVPIRSTLPGDCKRDDWFDTRWGDQPNRRKHQNTIANGGLYGLPWRADATVSYFPFFYGSPGQSTLTEAHRPWPYPLRVPQTFLRPFKPICEYYDQGSYVPVYDLDPFPPGPGVIWPFHVFPPITRDGG